MNILHTRFLSVLTAAVLAVCSAASAQSVSTTSPAGAVGWRGDGNGRYPDANPPLNWGRVAKSVKELSAQSSKPKDNALPAKESAIADGVIRQWLVLGPIAIPEGKKAEDLSLDAKDFSPDADDKSGDLKWKAVSLDTSCMDLCAITGIAPEQKGYMAYAHTYIYSPSGEPIAFDIMSQGMDQGPLQVWLNGTAITYGGKNVDFGNGVRLVLPVKKGWNRLLVLNAKTRNERRSWWFAGSLYGENTTDYESHGIAWITPSPAGGMSSPVIAGNRIFFTAESGCLVCVNKPDGKILWVRTTTYYDFATEEERKANTEAFTEMAPAVAKLKKCDLAASGKEASGPDRWNSEALIMKDMAKVDRAKYNNMSSYCEAGFTACTPITDGRNVYAVFGTGVVACYDLDGNRKWMRLVNHRAVEHGYTTSPLLVDGKLVIYMGSFIVLDAKTGDVVLERPHFVSGNTANLDWYNHFHGTGCVLTAGKEKVVYYLNGEFVRLSDGKTLTVDKSIMRKLKPDNYREVWANRIATPVVENGLAYKIIHNTGGAVAFKLGELDGDKVTPEIVHDAPFKTEKFPYYYENFYDASPLLHEGLLYCLNDFGVLTVMDMAKGEIVYQRQLDIEIFMPYSGAGPLKGGASSSPTLAGKYIYIWGNQGSCVVIEPGRTFKQVAKNRLEYHTPSWPDHQDATTTDPVFDHDRMYYRGEFALYCIGPK